MVEAQPKGITREDWATLRGKLMASDVALKVVIAVLAQDESRQRSLIRIMTALQDSRLGWTQEPELSDTDKAAFDKTLQEYLGYAIG